MIDERVAIDAVKSTGKLLPLDEFEPVVERAESADEAWETFRTALDMGEVTLLRRVGALRKLDPAAVSAWIQQSIAEREPEGDEVFAVLAALVVALITGDRAQLAALDDRLVRRYGDGGALGDAAMLYGPDDEDGPYVDGRELLVERWVEVGEIAAARRWFERVLRWPSGQPVGAQLVRCGPAEQTARALRGAVTAEAWAAIEVTAREALQSRDAKPEPTFVRWLLAQRSWVVADRLVEQADHPALDAADLWALLARWSSDEQCRATNGLVPCWPDGYGSDWIEWAKVERRSEPSRWSWSREDTARWIREKSSGDASWLFEPGAHALVRRLRDDDEGRALFDQLVWRMRVEPRWRDRDVLAASRLAPFAKKSPLSVTAQLAARRTPREPTLDAAVILASTRWGGAFEGEVRGALGAEARLAQGDLVALARLAMRAMRTALAGLDSLRSLGLDVPLSELCEAMAAAIEEPEPPELVAYPDRRFCDAMGIRVPDDANSGPIRDMRDWTRALSVERLRDIAAWGMGRIRERAALEPR